MSLDSIIFGETAGLRLEMTRNACASCGSHHYVENGQIKPTRKCAEFVYPLEAVFSEVYDFWREDNTPQVLYQLTCSPPIS